MNKTIVVLMLIGLLVLTGCSTATDSSKSDVTGIAQAAPEVAQAASEVIDTDTVEIGEMI
ncbi:MAG TPA: hypothetical protein VKE88_02285 [Candidatus Nanoarchaeia archaeon]|nr:hypothetical protein [Candidatus Nanoarchaeia archaeon]